MGVDSSVSILPQFGEVTRGLEEGRFDGSAAPSERFTCSTPAVFSRIALYLWGVRAAMSRQQAWLSWRGNGWRLWEPTPTAKK